MSRCRRDLPWASAFWPLSILSASYPETGEVHRRLSFAQWDPPARYLRDQYEISQGKKMDAGRERAAPAVRDPLPLFNPLLTFIALPILPGPGSSWWVSLRSRSRPFHAAYRSRHWGFILLVGLLCLLFGSLLLFDPFTRSRDVTDLIGLFGVIMGGLYVIDAFRYRKTEDTLDMML